MAGFLDRNSRIIDMVLTGTGKRLISQGKLHFCYWVPFDDEIDYDPFLSDSGSMSEQQLSASVYQSIESTPIREATTGYRFISASGSDNTNVHRPIFTMAQGQDHLPRALFPTDDTREIQITQRNVKRIYVKGDGTQNNLEPVDVGMERIDPTDITLELSYTRDSFPTDFQPEGFFIQLFKSGSDGLSELPPRIDGNNDIAFSVDLTFEKES